MPKIPGLPKVDKRKIDARVPAIPAAHDSLLLLAQIRDAINQLTQSGMQEDYSDYRDAPMTTAAGSELIQPDGQIGWLYIPDAPRDLSIFAGVGRGRILGTVTKGSYARFQIPKGQAVSVEWGTGATDATLSYWVSSRPIDYAALNPDMLSDTSGLVAAVHQGDSVAASGDYGVLGLAVRNDSMANALVDANGDYSPVSVGHRGQVFSALVGPTGNLSNVYTAGDAEANGPAGLLVLGRGALYNGSTWDRARGNEPGTALASQARTASTNSADITNYNGKGVHVVIDATAIAATPSVVFTIKGKDPASGVYYTLLASAAITGVGTTVLRIHPALTAAAGLVANDFVPRTWRVEAVHADADSITYSVGYVISE